jgi:hypothetical protein
MDLNLHYFNHQLSLLRAAETPSRLRRTLHLAAAGSAANRIRNFQLAAGAPAAASWVPGMEDRDHFTISPWSCSS